MGRIGRKKKPKPNYDILFQSAVNALQIAYQEYKKAVIESLKWTSYDKDGHFCILGDWEARNENVKNIERKIALASAEVEKYRRLREGEQE